MNRIELCEVLPDVFMQRENFRSQVWKQRVAFDKGELYLVEAASGTGKSSLCSFIYGYRNDFHGDIRFDERSTSRLKVRDWVNLRCHNLSMLWQELRLFPELSAWENVQIKNRLTHCQEERQIREWFDRLGIGDKFHTKIGLMSFGQQQRVAFIRALCQPYDFLFLDEPISHLDDANGQIMGQMILEEALKRQGAGVIVTSIGKHIELDYRQTLTL